MPQTPPPLLPIGAWLIAWAMVLVDLLPSLLPGGRILRWRLTDWLGVYDDRFEAALRGHVSLAFLLSQVGYLFVHLNTVHLAVNLVAFLGFSYVIQRMAGQRVLMILFFGSGIGGALAYGLLASGPAPVIGASGAVAGLVGAVTLWQRRPWLWAIVGLLMLADTLPGRGPMGAVAWEAHIGGFVTGSLLALGLRRR